MGAGLSFRQEKRSCLSAVCAQGFFFAGVCGPGRGPSTGAWTDTRPQTPGGHVCRAVRPILSASPELGLEGWAARALRHSLGLGLLCQYCHVTPQRTSPALGTWALSALRAEGARENGGHIYKGQKPGGCPRDTHRLHWQMTPRPPGLQRKLLWAPPELGLALGDLSPPSQAGQVLCPVQTQMLLPSHTAGPRVPGHRL